MGKEGQSVFDDEVSIKFEDTDTEKASSYKLSISVSESISLAKDQSQFKDDFSLNDDKKKSGNGRHGDGKKSLKKFF